MKILITGASGHLGLHLVLQLVAENTHEITAFSLDATTAESLKNFNTIKKVDGDICDSNIVESLNVSPDNLHPMMHKTDTLDYIIILSGELYLILEESETLLKPGDIVIQQGTNHAWSNRSDKPCIQLAILLDAKKQ